MGLHCWTRALSSCGEGDYSSLWSTGFSIQRLLLLQSMGSRMSGPQELRHLGSVIMAPGLGCSSACGIFLDQGSNRCPLHCKADSQLLGYQGSPRSQFCGAWSLSEGHLLEKEYMSYYFSRAVITKYHRLEASATILSVLEARNPR